jgi:hypothetical protein
VLGNSADGIEGALAGNGILLVAELLPQKLDSPGRVLVSDFLQ